MYVRGWDYNTECDMEKLCFTENGICEEYYTSVSSVVQPDRDGIW